MSTIPLSVPALASGITSEQIQALVADWSVGSRTEDWEVREYETLGDWAVAILHTDLFPAQLSEAGMLGAAFKKEAGAWFFAFWVSVEESWDQEAIKGRQTMRAPEEVWSYFDDRHVGLMSTTATKGQ